MLMTHRKKNIGFSLIEVLVTIVILLIGLLGLAGLQGRALTSELESFQRSQALILLKDMENRINANRKNALDYVTSTPLGAGADCSVAVNPVSAVSGADRNEWCNALKGAAEGVSTGAMIGARGCVYEITAPAIGVPSTYLAVVSWQGLNNTKAPDVSTATSAGQCGVGQYGNESLHRVVTLPISIADLN
jgi:type IV pilus assembly protein PilV